MKTITDTKFIEFMKSVYCDFLVNEENLEFNQGKYVFDLEMEISFDSDRSAFPYLVDIGNYSRSFPETSLLFVKARQYFQNCPFSDFNDLDSAEYKTPEFLVQTYFTNTSFSSPHRTPLQTMTPGQVLKAIIVRMKFKDVTPLEKIRLLSLYQQELLIGTKK